MPKYRKKKVTEIDRLLSWCRNCGAPLTDKDIRKRARYCKRCRKAIAQQKLGRFSK